MKRLTNNIKLGFQDSNKLPSYVGLWDYLKKYEDIGLEPEEIVCCINLLKDKCWACSNARAYKIGNSSLKTCKYRMKGCVAATAQPDCEHWALDVGCLRKPEQQEEIKGCSGECDLCPDADDCEQCGSI